jgi:multidrug efflux pump subunit AcrA (membrane-fusion protein)
VLVPLAALTRDAAGRAVVLVVDGGHARPQPVETGAADARHVLVRKGLAGGEPVVAVAEGVKANQRVQAAPGAPP